MPMDSGWSNEESCSDKLPWTFDNSRGFVESHMTVDEQGVRREGNDIGQCNVEYRDPSRDPAGRMVKLFAVALVPTDPNLRINSYWGFLLYSRATELFPYLGKVVTG
jgi:hypothetical protein